MRQIIRNSGLTNEVTTLGIFGVIIYSGFLKIHDPSTASQFLEGLIGTSWRWMPGAAAALEIGVAMWLVSGRARGLAGLTAAALFVAFAVMHGAAWALGVDDACGCLGPGSVLDRMPHSAWIAFTTFLAMICLWTVRGVPLRTSRTAASEAPI